MKFHVDGSFLHNFGAAGENFGLSHAKLKKALKRSNAASKRSQKLQTPLNFLVKFYFFGGECPLPLPSGGYATVLPFIDQKILQHIKLLKA